ncbi:ribosomal protein L1p/L10e family-domain-containing protein [Mrakia frigida]|uniref:ribosomal L1 domain-containing protein n=1 Tax=Mrakia frigida TaxID=29902 RepID=UPI003FCBFF53
MPVASTSTTPSLVDGHVSYAQAEKAVNALSSYAVKARAQKEDTELIVKEENVWLVVATKSINPEKKLKPIKITLPNPLIDPRTTSICLLVKDPQREYKDLLETNKIKFVSRVVGVTKLRGKFKPFEARRQLLGEHGMFLADERIVPLLPKLLGKGWFDAKKQPVPVCLTRKDLKAELERAVSATYMHLTQGTCTSIKISPLPSHTPSQTLANLLSAIPQVVSNIKGGWSSIQSLNIKTSSSVSLPIWSCELGDKEGQRWDGVGEEAWELEEEGAEGAKKEVKGGKGKKRSAAEAVEGGEEKAVVSEKKVKVKGPRPVSTKTAPAPVAAAVVPSPKASKKVAAPTPAVKEPKKVMAGTPKKGEPSVEKKKTASGAGKAAKEGVVGKKGGAKKVAAK